MIGALRFTFPLPCSLRYSRRVSRSLNRSRISCWFTAHGWMRRAGGRSTTNSPAMVSGSPWCRSQRPRSPPTSRQRSACSTCRMARRFWSAIAMADRSSRRPVSIPKSLGSSMSRRTPRCRGGRRRTRPEDTERPRQDPWRNCQDGGWLHLSEPGRLPEAFRARSASRAGCLRIALTGAGRGHRIHHAAHRRRLEDKAELGDRRQRRPDHRSRSRALVLRPRE